MDISVDIIELLDILYGMVTEAWGVPLGNDKCIIEREKAVEIINEIKSNLPSALSEAKRLVAARDEFIGNAKREAEAMRKSAEERARAMVEEQEIVRVARQKSAEMIGSAEATSNELRRLASDYVDEIMSSTEKSVSEALSKLQGAHNAFKSAGGVSPAKAEAAPAAPVVPVAPAAPAQPEARKPAANTQAMPNFGAAAPKAPAAPAAKRPAIPMMRIPKE